MNYDSYNTVILAYTISNIVGLLLLFAAYKIPKLARLMFLLLFAWASWVNYTTCRLDPDVYLSYSDKSIKLYSDFIQGWFRDNIVLFVTIIAIGQGLISLGMLLKGWCVTLACFGAIFFLLSIAPLGLYAAFPFSITVSVAAYFIWRRDDKNYLWKWKVNKPQIQKV